MHFFLCVSVSGQDNSDEIAGHVCQNCLSQRKEREFVHWPHGRKVCIFTSVHIHAIGRDHGFNKQLPRNTTSLEGTISAKQFIVDFAEDYGQRTLPATSWTRSSPSNSLGTHPWATCYVNQLKRDTGTTKTGELAAMMNLYLYYYVEWSLQTFNQRMNNRLIWKRWWILGYRQPS